MRYVVHFGPEAMHIELEGAFTFADTRQFHKMMTALSSIDGRQSIKINLSRLTLIDSTGVGLLMAAHDAAKKLQRELVFFGARDGVMLKLVEAGKYNMLKIA